MTGIDHRIESDAEAEDTLVQLISLLSSSGRRLVILLDEFQRIGHLNRRVRDGFLAHVRSLFSRSPAHFSLVLAIGSRVEKTALDLIPAELKTLMGIKPPITLPEMSKDEALAFVRARLLWYRPSGSLAEGDFPFADGQVQHVLDYMVDIRAAKIIPRNILQILGLIYDEMLDQDLSPLKTPELDLFLESLRWGEVGAEDVKS